ncbi:FKBP-type peptidyl-prolyl cis-trans isomerase [Neptuniibacter sp. QD72_48]|uniref:FKBP-type peptidyl-prolyl cis-trans isomerase n=1 Tax=unclassified Neptuniibacter TaxID=2630693 RepID=UPI0039F5E412
MEYVLPLLILAIVLFLYTSRQNNLKLAEANKKAGEEFLAENTNDPDVTQTSSGLQFKVIEKADGTSKPSATSTVKVHYHGTLIDGTVFDSSVDRGEPIEFGLNQVIKGWTEGLQLMATGDKYRFYIPSNLAYGNGSAGVITPGSVLIFDVELLDFKN